MTDPNRFQVKTRVEDRIGNRGRVIETPWREGTDWIVKIKWDDPHNPTSINTITDERVVNLTIVYT
jgi:hypothetical protein